ncbi:MAG: hypothetical protein JNK82_28540 [Myxococcaceae bacterium]|nr:hypothetical protein [Myxococcaceae bacterium]
MLRLRTEGQVHFTAVTRLAVHPATGVCVVALLGAIFAVALFQRRDRLLLAGLGIAVGAVSAAYLAWAGWLPLFR